MKSKIFLLSCVMLLAAFTASAAQFIAPDKSSDGSISLSAEEQHRNLYVVGSNVNVNSPIQGDLTAAGASVTVNGSVEQDANVAGGNVNLNGKIGGDLRTAGGNVTINSPVSGDLLAGAGNLNIYSQAAVGGDVAIGAGSVILDSVVSGSARIGGGTVTINGTINGNLNVIASQKLVFGPNSKVTGTIVYKGPVEAEVKAGASVGTIQYTKMEARRFDDFARRGLFGFGFIIKLLALLVSGLLFLYFAPGKIRSVLASIHNSFWASFGIGILILIATPIVAVLCMVTIVGIYVGAVLMLLYFLALILAGILTPFYLGGLILGWYRRTEPAASWLGLIVGLIAGALLGLIPFVGWFIVGVVFILSLGALVRTSMPERMQARVDNPRLE